jgi:hypothetical protein
MGRLISPHNTTSIAYHSFYRNAKEIGNPRKKFTKRGAFYRSDSTTGDGGQIVRPTGYSIDRKADEEKRNPGRFDYQASGSRKRNTPSRQAPTPV